MPDPLSIISLQAMLALPWYVGIPGLLAIALLLVSAFLSLIGFRLVRAITRLVLAFAIALILSQGGEAITRLLGAGPPASS